MVGEYESSARVGAMHLPFRSRWAVLAAAGIYGDIARKVDALDHAAWDQRVMTTKVEKAGWMVRAMGQAIVNRPKMVGRAGLWERPKG